MGYPTILNNKPLIGVVFVLAIVVLVSLSFLSRADYCYNLIKLSCNIDHVYVLGYDPENGIVVVSECVGRLVLYNGENGQIIRNQSSSMCANCYDFAFYDKYNGLLYISGVLCCSTYILCPNGSIGNSCVPLHFGIYKIVAIGPNYVYGIGLRHAYISLGELFYRSEYLVYVNNTNFDIILPSMSDNSTAYYQNGLITVVTNNSKGGENLLIINATNAKIVYNETLKSSYSLIYCPKFDTPLLAYYGNVIYVINYTNFKILGEIKLGCTVKDLVYYEQNIIAGVSCSNGGKILDISLYSHNYKVTTLLSKNNCLFKKYDCPSLELIDNNVLIVNFERYAYYKGCYYVFKISLTNGMVSLSQVYSTSYKSAYTGDPCIAVMTCCKCVHVVNLTSLSVKTETVSSISFLCGGVYAYNYSTYFETACYAHDLYIISPVSLTFPTTTSSTTTTTSTISTYTQSTTSSSTAPSTSATSSTTPSTTSTSSSLSPIIFVAIIIIIAIVAAIILIRKR
ncbi:hypothetical protein DDW13_05910 [Acidianus hospitalis]|uniref:Uncharacterized protein n=1 Tax=Acidianus hospitalis TaxID=563177 RepID=A0A2T9X457_9CREN|nr:hypothetical protein DDW13_05910 [Acidianus hospitalis]